MPTIARIKNEASEIDARALLYIAICEVCDFFNVGKNMNDTQVAMTVDLIIEKFWHLKLTEIKYCFHRAMMREKLFDRLDGNIILGWLKEYDAERTEEAMRISENKESRMLNEIKEDPDAVSYEDYLKGLRQRAKTSDEAAQLLESINSHPSQPGRHHLSREEQQQKDHNFKIFKLNYLLNKNK